MRAIAIDRFGTPDVCVLRDVAVPAPGPDDALIEIDHAGVNFIDIYMRNGTYARSSTYRTPLPLVLGMEGSGRVAEVGRNVRSLAVGDRVAYAPFRGSYAEFAVVPAWKVARVPDGIGQDVACAAMLQGTTAHYLTHATYPLKPGDWCLVHAAAGGAGQLIVQFAKRRGATVIATVGSAEKAAIAKARGADHVILYKEEDVAAAVRELTGGRGVDVAYDSVGKATFSASLKSVRRRGLLVLFGSASGVVDRVDPLELAGAEGNGNASDRVQFRTSLCNEQRTKHWQRFRRWCWQRASSYSCLCPPRSHSNTPSCSPTLLPLQLATRKRRPPPRSRM